MTLLHVRAAAKRTGISRIKLVRAIRAMQLSGYCQDCRMKLLTTELSGQTRHRCPLGQKILYPVLVSLEEIELRRKELA